MRFTKFTYAVTLLIYVRTNRSNLCFISCQVTRCMTYPQGT